MANARIFGSGRNSRSCYDGAEKSRGGRGVGIYTDSDSHVSRDPRYDDQGNWTRDIPPDLGGITQANPPAENNEDYIQPIYPARGLSQKLNKR